MALFCGQTAIIGLGISCQTAMQLVRNCEFVGRLLGAEATNHVTPFDWLICDTAATARMIESDEYFPNNQTEIELEPKPRWKRMGCYY
jgi:hypothetical protein